jgi:hypothetical protein
MTTQHRAPATLPSEDVILSAPMSYTGSARRIMRIRRRASGRRTLVVLTVLAVLLVIVVWGLVTVWYVLWSVLLVPYRVIRRRERKRRVEALRHRELVAALAGSPRPPLPEARAAPPPDQLISDADRDVVVEELREHMLAGRITTDELEDRLGSAQAARTRADLAAAKRNLPPIDSA